MIERIEVNLLPYEYRDQSKKIVIPKGSFIIAVAVSLVVVTIFIMTANINSRIDILTRENREKKAEIDKYRPLLKEINTLKKRKSEVTIKIGALEKISIDREKWVRLQETFVKQLPQTTWIDKITERKGKARELEIVGRTYSFSEAAVYMGRLRETKAVTKVDLLDITMVSTLDRVYKFTIICHVQ